MTSSGAPGGERTTDGQGGDARCPEPLFELGDGPQRSDDGRAGQRETIREQLNPCFRLHPHRLDGGEGDRRPDARAIEQCIGHPEDGWTLVDPRGARLAYELDPTLAEEIVKFRRISHRKQLFARTCDLLFEQRGKSVGDPGLGHPRIRSEGREK
jgi:hypothetical protein